MFIINIIILYHYYFNIIFNTILRLLSSSLINLSQHKEVNIFYKFNCQKFSYEWIVKVTLLIEFSFKVSNSVLCSINPVEFERQLKS